MEQATASGLTGPSRHCLTEAAVRKLHWQAELGMSQGHAAEAGCTLSLDMHGHLQ
jgi:hypothetical protein